MITIRLWSNRSTISDMYALIDDCDRDLAHWRWTWNGSRKSVTNQASMKFLKRLIMSRMLARPLRAGEYVFFHDNDPLNCQRANLYIRSNTECPNIPQNRKTPMRQYPQYKERIEYRATRHTDPWFVLKDLSWHATEYEAVTHLESLLYHGR